MYIIKIKTSVFLTYFLILKGKFKKKITKLIY